jgi:hypothetical protein
LLTSDKGAASRACRSDGNGTTVARSIMTTSWRSRRMVRSNGPVSSPDERCMARSRSASAPVAFSPTNAVPMPSWTRCRASLSRPRVRPASLGKGFRDQFQQPRALMRIWLMARDGGTRKGRRAVNAPTVTSIPSIANPVDWLVQGRKQRTITA